MAFKDLDKEATHWTLVRNLTGLNPFMAVDDEELLLFPHLTEQKAICIMDAG
jgi:hypothetical protein